MAARRPERTRAAPAAGGAPRTNEIDVERMLADLDQGILDDRVERFLPDELFGPPTAAELAGEHPDDGRPPRASGVAPLRTPNTTGKPAGTRKRGTKPS